jgi:hypothetical protein
LTAISGPGSYLCGNVIFITSRNITLVDISYRSIFRTGRYFVLVDISYSMDLDELAVQRAVRCPMDINNLDWYCEDCVIGGPGSFVVSINGAGAH